MHRYKYYYYLALALIVAAAVKCAAFTPPVRLTDPRRIHRSDLHPVVGISSMMREIRRHPPITLLRSSATGDQPVGNYIRPYIKQLLLLCRPSNFPVVALFHALGVFQAVQLWESAAAVSPSSPSLLLPLLKHPSMLVVLLSLLLVTATSMLTNDYYDAKNGVDSINDGADSEYAHYHPLARGEVPLSVAKIFDSYLYAILLLTSAFVPGVISRLLVLGGAIITYLYTSHLKPITVVKNISCAALVALSPVTSGLAAWHVLCEGSFLKSQGVAGVDSTALSTLPFRLIFTSPLSYLVVALFFGIMRYVAG